jgi:hypothetical protein
MIDAEMIKDLIESAATGLAYSGVDNPDDKEAWETRMSVKCTEIIDLGHLALDGIKWRELKTIDANWMDKGQVYINTVERELAK